ncbi:DUF262 domain-containing protein [Anoxybacillus salavatliensis]|uniref:DUF262 domain-containing protein n=1 Tax=Anoxybacillus gonensis TaxID=198467 RepID=UPI00214D0C66|nr:DUF262 domain-containing protein [Anoxybacillus gonensis]MCQ5365977.1 DUF262 domain-containing protein [Anoxybacillus gonensis]
MSYKAISIKEIVSMISNNEVYLPAIQRKFVWSHEQIERLFDSIMLGYPIGTFLFWTVKKEKVNDYKFYKFIQDYHERDKCLNDPAPWPDMREKIIAVLDGQQRLGSLYVALQGSYAYKKPRARWDNDDAFPTRLLCFNILHNVRGEEDEMTFQFKFLTEDEMNERNEHTFWFPVKKALLWKNATDFTAFARENGLFANDTAVNNLALLWQRITQDDVINYFEVEEDELDDVLDIFIRVNSGGTVLSKSDLLFSTIVASWEDARSEIESLLRTLNGKGDGFSFDNDFVMRACLVLTDCPVLFNAKNFKQSNIYKIKTEWKKIKTSLSKTVDLLVEFGFSKDNLISRNSIIPIAYHIFKGGDLKKEDKENIRKYLISSLLKQIFGGKGDRVLESIRNTMRIKSKDVYILKQNEFPFEVLRNTRLPAGKTLKFDGEDLESLFDYEKGPYTFMILSLLYPHLKLGQIKFHQDHVHPYSQFRKNNLKKLGLDERQQNEWIAKRDTIPNLQLLEGVENKSKSNKTFKEWIHEENNISHIEHYKKVHYIPDVDLDFSNFEQFYNERKKLMKKRFEQVMNGESYPVV